MELVIKKDKQITSLKELREKKQMLIQKADLKALKIKSKVDKLVNNTSPQLMFDDVLEKFELQHSLLNFLPSILKYRHLIGNLKWFSDIKNSPKKRAVLIGIGALITSLVTYYYLNRKRQTDEG